MQSKTRADCLHSICAITIVRIKITTEINGQNLIQQYAKIALLTCLEALLGIINACLPVMKPIFSKLGAIGTLKSFWTGTAIATSIQPIGSPPSNRTNHLSLDQEKYPYIRRPSQTVHRESLHTYPVGSSPDVRPPSIPMPNFSWRPLSKFYQPKTEVECDPLPLKQDDRAGRVIEWDFGRRTSEGDSPTLPWKTQWHRPHKM